jgi:hypothetical protein
VLRLAVADSGDVAVARTHAIDGAVEFQPQADWRE